MTILSVSVGLVMMRVAALIEFPDLPGCLSDGATIEEAIASGADALASWIATAKRIRRPGAAAASPGA